LTHRLRVKPAKTWRYGVDLWFPIATNTCMACFCDNTHFTLGFHFWGCKHTLWECIQINREYFPLILFAKAPDLHKYSSSDLDLLSFNIVATFSLFRHPLLSMLPYTPHPPCQVISTFTSHPPWQVIHLVKSSTLICKSSTLPGHPTYHGIHLAAASNFHTPHPPCDFLHWYTSAPYWCSSHDIILFQLASQQDAFVLKVYCWLHCLMSIGPL
jgi:hypothetical protein